MRIGLDLKTLRGTLVGLLPTAQLASAMAGTLLLATVVPGAEIGGTRAPQLFAATLSSSSAIQQDAATDPLNTTAGGAGDGSTAQTAGTPINLALPRPGLDKAPGFGNAPRGPSAGIRAEIRYDSAPACQALRTIALEGGFPALLGQALEDAQSEALRGGLGEIATEAMLRQAIQAALIKSNTLPKDALVAIQALQIAERDCAGSAAARAALSAVASVVLAQTRYDTPTATASAGTAPIANPQLPSPVSIGRASYRSTVLTP
jgi:hypothetical protein